MTASILTVDDSASLRMAIRIALTGAGYSVETGTVWINEVQHLTPFQPFAGHKQSGIGVENGLSGLLEYTVAQTITVKRAA